MLVNLTLKHKSDFYRWICNKFSVKYSLSIFLPERNNIWVENYIKTISENDNLWNQVIVEKDKNIGYCGLSNISLSNKNAEYFILIGDNEFWGKGIGTAVGKKVLYYGFEQLRLNRIWLTVSSLNAGAIKSYQKLGFKKEGIMREASFRDSKYHDKIVMGILKKEWQE